MAGKISSKEAERLRGRMLAFDEDLRRALEFLLHRVNSSQPILVTKKLEECWFIFTDGACEADDECGSIGGVLVSPSGECLRYFSSDVPSNILRVLLRDSKNPIHELEVMPVLVSLMLWAEFVSFSPLVHYIDNESSRMALIKRLWKDSQFGKTGEIICAVGV